MEKIYIIAGENIYYLEYGTIISIEGYSGFIHDGYLKHPTFVKPIYDIENQIFIETATPEEIYNDKLEKASLIDEEYTSKISKLVGKHIEKFIIDNVQIPDSILSERLILIQECNQKIQDLDVYEITYKVSKTEKK